MNHKFKHQLIIMSASNLKTKKLERKNKFHSIRITVAITENYVDTQSENPVRTVLGTVS